MLHFIPQKPLIYTDISLQSDFVDTETSTMWYPESVDTSTCLVQIVHNMVQSISQYIYWNSLLTHQQPINMCLVVHESDIQVGIVQFSSNSIPTQIGMAWLGQFMGWFEVVTLCLRSNENGRNNK